MKKIKYILIKIEMFAFVCSFVLGMGAADSDMWGWAYLLMFGPFVLGKILKFEKQIDFLEVYDRAWSIKLKNSK